MRILSTKTYITLTALCLLPTSVSLAQDDVERRQSVLLDSVVISARRHTNALKQNTPGSYDWNMQQLDLLPKVFGNADPIHYAQMLPGIQTNSEYRCGINIDGCDNAHNAVTISGVPVYNVGHLLGFFSIFNGSHFKKMNIKRAATNGAYPNRIGGTLDMTPFLNVADSLEGEYSVGLISSQGTMRTPLGRNTSATISIRGSYLNLLYGRWLKADNTQIYYQFGDANVSVIHKFSEQDRLLIDFYTGIDNAKFNEANYLAKIKAKWGNTTGAIHWLHEGQKWRSHHSIYVSSYHNHFRLQMEEAEGRMPSYITDFGLKTSYKWRQLSFGGDVVAHFIRPQTIYADNFYSDITSVPDRQNAMETSVYADWKQPLAASLSLNAGIRLTLWHIDRHNFKSADPSLTLQYDNNKGLKMSVSWFMRHQYLFQTGFSDAGLPTEFWMSADRNNKPQYCSGVTAGASIYFGKRMWQLSADIFYRRMYNQIEYSGSMLDCLNASYDLNNYLLHGKGRNVGCNIMLQKCAGAITGWCSYTFTRARRTFNEEGHNNTYPANHERPHELNAVMAWSTGKHLTIGATFVFASGTPFTAPVSASILNGNIIATYGKHNANRLGAYGRLDISVNYKWKPKHAKERGINLSIYNATSRRNDLFYRIDIMKDGAFAVRPVSFMLDVLPSVSYYCKF